jgi:hypothetical protein
LEYPHSVWEYQQQEEEEEELTRHELQQGYHPHWDWEREQASISKHFKKKNNTTSCQARRRGFEKIDSTMPIQVSTFFLLFGARQNCGE